jgi:phage terminase Nu1 subunit (DNA packaging protein)
MVNQEIMLTMQDMALGLQNQIDKQGRPMTPQEVAAVAMAFALQQSALWLRETLGKSADERLDQSILLLRHHESLLNM